MIPQLVDRRLQGEEEIGTSVTSSVSGTPGDHGVSVAPGPFWDLLNALCAPLARTEWLVNLVLVDDAAMVQLNGRYRAADAVTDVLSFSYLDAEGPGTPALAAGDRYAFHDLWQDAPPGAESATAIATATTPEPSSVLCGEVVMAPRFIADRCREQGWDLAAEVALLMVHGCLHLLGWEHTDEQSRKAMQTVESALLERCGIPHPLRGKSRID